MRPGEKAILPVWLRTGIVVALVITLGYSFAHRKTPDAPTTLEPVAVAVDYEQGEVVSSRKLHFVDLETGGISVINAADGSEIARLEVGEDGFMRSVMRGFVRERKAKGLGPEVPFELAMFDDGLVSMIDPATLRRVELSAFGIDNVKAFTRLLPEGPTADTSAIDMIAPSSS